MIFQDLYTSTTLAHDIDELRNPQTTITPIRVANMVTKFFVNYALSTNGRQKFSFSDAALVCAKTEILSPEVSTIGGYSFSGESLVGDDIYQISMLGDLAATTAICMEIITSTDLDIASKVANILDLGSGSGILLLAGHIRACRQRRRIESSIGIEYLERVAQRSNHMARALSFGEIYTGDTRSPETYSALKHTPTIILNENLPSTDTAFYTSNKLGVREPFLFNCFHLNAQFGDKLTSAYMFPDNTRLMRGSVVWGEKFGLYPQSERHPLWLYILEHATESAEKKQDMLQWISQRVCPLAITIGDTMTLLTNIGAGYRCSIGTVRDSGAIFSTSPSRHCRW